MGGGEVEEVGGYHLVCIVILTDGNNYGLQRWEFVWRQCFVAYNDNSSGF